MINCIFAGAFGGIFAGALVVGLFMLLVWIASKM